MRKVLGLLIAATLTGCYAYMPVSGGTAPAVGQRVRVTLTSEGTTELARFLGPRVVQAEGALRANTDTSFAIQVDMVQLADGLRQPWTGEGVVYFPRNYITDVKQRTYQRRRSIVTSAAVTGGLILVAIVAINAADAGGGSGGGGGPPPP